MSNGIKKLNNCEIYLRLFRWIVLVLFSALLIGGVDSIVFSINGKPIFKEGTSLADFNFWRNLFVSCFLLLALLIYVMRYIIWTPWSIYERINNFRNVSETEVSDSDLDHAIKTATNKDIGISLIYLIVEFFIALFMIKSIGLSVLTFILIIFLPLLDYCFPMFIVIIRFIIFVVIDIPYLLYYSVFKGKHIELPEWRQKLFPFGVTIPRYFLKANLIDAILPTILLFIYYYFGKESMFFCKTMLVISLSLSSFIVYSLHKEYYRKMISIFLNSKIS